MVNFETNIFYNNRNFFNFYFNNKNFKKTYNIEILQ